ncbi:hypothetical protein, partial [Escherichia coli]|uniref:hypothetical protein n=1 Tax=Escherichia coli TaxID=562 RepID=UPI0021B449CA
MGSCAAPSAKGDDKFITTDYLQQCRDISGHAGSHVELSRRSHWNMTKSSTLDSFRSKGGTLSFVTD